MAWVANNPEQAKAKGYNIPTETAQEFVEEDAKSGRLSKAMKERKGKRHD